MKRKTVLPNPSTFIEEYIRELSGCLKRLDRKKIEILIDILVDAYKKDRTVFIIGNGGSASTASHMACDLSKGTLQRVYDTTERRFRVISLTDNVALMTAYANDLQFDEIFAQQLRNLIETDDVVIALSGSGNSKNIVNAIKYAKSCGALTIGVLGFKAGGAAGKLVDHAIIADSDHYGPIEDIQLVLNHIIAAWLAKIKHIHDGKKRQTSKNKAVPFS